MNNKRVAGIGISAFGAIFLLVAVLTGGVFGIVSYFMNKQVTEYEEEFEEFKTDAVKTKGVIVFASAGTKVEYEDEDGNEYEASFNVTNSEWKKGQRVELYYNEDDPEDVRVPEIECEVLELLSKIFMFVAFGVIGLFGGIGVIILAAGFKVARRNKGVKENAAGYVSSGYDYSQISAGKGSNEINHSSDYTGVNKDLL